LLRAYPFSFAVTTHFDCSGVRIAINLEILGFTSILVGFTACG